KGVAALSQKVDAISTRFETLFAQADDLTKKQLSLETLHERLAEVDDLAKQTALQMNGLKESRQDLEALRKDVQDFYKWHGEIAQLRDRLGADRLALEAFGDRMTAMATRAPELEAKMEAILGKMTVVEEGTHKAARLHETVAELDEQISLVTARVPFVEKLEERLNGLNAVSADGDHKLQEELARRAELEALKSACDGLEAQMADAQHKLDAVRQLQQRLVPLVGEIGTLKSDIATAHQRIGAVKFD